MTEPLYSMSFTAGLLGSGHCIGMCGGIVAALSLSQEGRRGGIPFHLLYHAGRVATYALIGLLVGWLGSAIAYADRFSLPAKAILIGSDLFIIVIGLGTAGLFKRLDVMQLEMDGLGQKLTRVVSTLRGLPAGLSALPLGLVMGFLPCGFLYAMAITAAQSADPFKGTIVMLMFGLGTTPAILLFGSAAHWLSARARTWMLRGAGIVVAAMGGYNLFQHIRVLGWI